MGYIILGEEMGDTIAAIATASGEAGVGIVRISGDKSLDIMKKMFLKCPQNPVERHVYFGRVLDVIENEIVDEAIFIFMKGPATYTGEDVLEIQAHGSDVGLKKILKSAIYSGARIAEPGEFTKLAFLNGKLDLTQAEAVMDLISAKSEFPLKIAERQLEGKLGKTIIKIREDLLNLLAEITVSIDFPDEDIEEFTKNELKDKAFEIEKSVKELINTASIGMIAKNGFKVSIIGKPNVGKSSLLNGILGEDRAIVTDISGTTRDTIEERIFIKGIPVILSDTAGIRETEDIVENIGIERAKKAIEGSDLTIAVMDLSREFSKEDKHIIEILKEKRYILVLNKKDLEKNLSEKELMKMTGPDKRTIYTDMNSYEGIDNVLEAVKDILEREYLTKNHENGVVTDERQREILERSEKDIREGIALLERGESLEITEILFRNAFRSLGEIIGEEAGEQVLDRVFSRFCLGK